MVLIFDTDILPKVRFIGSVSYKTPWVHFHRKIDEYVLYIIKSGELYIKEADVKYILKKGDVLLLQSNIPHEGYKSSCCDYYFVHFNLHSAATAGGTNSNEKMVYGFHHFVIIKLGSEDTLQSTVG